MSTTPSGPPYEKISSALFPKARRAVLGVLYGHHDRQFYLREIVELTGLGMGHVQRELKRLEAAGILQRRRQGRHVYFQANPACPIFADLRAIVTKTVGAAEVLREALRPLRERIVAAFIFGSLARGQERDTSDLDLMVIGEATLGQVAEAIRPAEQDLGREINPSVYPAGEFRRKLSAGHHFLASVMKSEKVFVLGDEHELGAFPGQPLDS